MLKNIKKLAISKQFLISLIFVALMIAAVGSNIENSYAADLNETVDDLGVELDVEDKLENSQSDEKLSASYSLNGGTYRDIQNVVDRASDGDTIKLSGTFVAQSTTDAIEVNKRLTITSPSTATFDGKSMSNAFKLQRDSAGTSLSNLIFINGHSSNEGGAIRITAKSILIDHCSFKNNYAKDSSGAIHTSYTPKVAEDLTISYCKFTENAAGTAAGAVGVFGYNFKIYNSIFEGNWVRSKNNCYGGAIQVGLDTGLSKGVVGNCIFNNNKAISTSGTSHGGAGCLRNGTTYINCEFNGNGADHGGAITFHASGKLENCVFKDNRANEYGGALSISLEQRTMVLNINKCVFDGNAAPIGGAAKLDGMNVNIRNSNFTNNYASKYGGAVYIDAKDVNILSSYFKKNIANINGGAVYINGRNTVINRTSFLYNEAIPNVHKLNDGLGGALYVNSTQASVNSNAFKYNTARNGSAIYYDKTGTRLSLNGNLMTQNQAWVYQLPVYAHDINYGEVENISSIIYGGNNIAKYNNLAVSNAIYNAARVRNIVVDGQTPVLGATMSGDLYQDSREYNMKILMTVAHEDGTIVYNKTLDSSYLGEVCDNLTNLKPGKYYVRATHYEDTYYKGITNVTTFRVIPRVDNRILKVAESRDEFNYEDKVVWTLDIVNNGPNDATDVVVKDVLPEGLIYYSDDSGGKYDPKTGTLTIGDLSVGQHVIVNIVTTINKTGEITNDANVTAKEYDIDLSNNYDNASISVNPAIDLAVVKSVNNTKPNYNDVVDWTIVVRNNGPDVAHDVKVVDILPKSLIYLRSTGGYDQINGCWDIGTLNVGAEVFLHLITKVNSTGLIENDVSVSGFELDHDLSNNFDNESINVKPASDLAINKLVNASSANYNDLVKWTLVVTNNGPDDATGVYVVDTLPTGFVYVRSNLDRGTYSNGKITIGNLAIGETLRFDIVCRVKNTGNFINVATITGNEHDHDLTNNRDDEPILIHPAADLEVIKEVSESKPKYGNSIVWSVTVKNNGPDTAHDVKVRDVLPNSLSWIEDNGNGKYNHNTGLWDIGQLANGASVKLNIKCKIIATGNTTNYVSVTGREYDYNLVNNFDNETIDVEPAADLAVEKSVNNTSPNYHDLVKWTLIITNNGPDKATDVYIQEKIPEGLILVNYTASKGIFDDGRWAMCCLNKSEVQSMELICKVNKTGKIVNIVSISGNEYDPNPKNNNDEEFIQVPPSVDLELIKDVNNTDPEFGDTIQWSVLIKNNGPDVATGVVVEDVLPQGLILLDWQSSRGNFTHDVWNIGSLNVGAMEVLNITCIVDKLGEITNYAEVTSNEYDWNEANNYDVSSVEVTPVVDLAIVKLVNDTAPNYGDIIKWTLVVTNNGPNDATGVVVYDTLPRGLTLIKAIGGNYIDGIWGIGDLDAEDSQILELICKVSATGECINEASVMGEENDPDLSNNYDSESINVPPASDIAITKTASKYYYKVGDVVRYAINIVNNGPDKAENVRVSEVMDDSLKLKSFRASAGDFDKLTKTWDVGSLDVGESASLNLDTVATKKGVLNNTVKASSDSYDPDLSNNEDFASVDVSDNESATPKSHEKIVDKKVPDEVGGKILEKNVSGNSFFILLISLIFSMVLLRGDNSKRR